MCNVSRQKRNIGSVGIHGWQPLLTARFAERETAEHRTACIEVQAEAKGLELELHRHTSSAENVRGDDAEAVRGHGEHIGHVGIHGWQPY